MPHGLPMLLQIVLLLQRLFDFRSLTPEAVRARPDTSKAGRRASGERRAVRSFLPFGSRRFQLIPRNLL